MKRFLYNLIIVLSIIICLATFITQHDWLSAGDKIYASSNEQVTSTDCIGDFGDKCDQFILQNDTYEKECRRCSQIVPSDNYDADKYPLMPVTVEQKHREAESYKYAPLAVVRNDFKIATANEENVTTYVNLLSHLAYNPSDTQGRCGNCWVWAGTRLLGIAQHVQTGIKKNLSIQYFNSNYCYSYVPSLYETCRFACCGGNVEKFVAFYDAKRKVIPATNNNAGWADESQSCYDGTVIDWSSITEIPGYSINSIGPAQLIDTFGVEQITAINNIKAFLNDNQAVYFAFYFADMNDWNKFFSFWDNYDETSLWQNGFSCGKPYRGGGGHAVACVGYDETPPGIDNDYWIMLNSWGTADGNRPNGIFHIPMYYNYDCADSSGDPNTYWWTVPVQFTPVAPVPPKPSIVAPKNNRMIFRWNKVSNAVDYELEVNTGPTFNPSGVIYKARVGNVTAKIVSEIPSGVRCYWRLRAIYKTFKTQQRGGGQEITDYICGRWQIGSSFILGTAKSSFNNSGFYGIVKYREMLCSTNIDEFILQRSDFTGNSARNYQTPKLIAPYDNKIRFRWKPSTGATKYMLEVNTSPNFEKSGIIFKKNLGNVRAYYVDCIPAGKRCYWRVRAGNDTGWSGWQNGTTFILYGN